MKRIFYTVFFSALFVVGTTTISVAQLGVHVGPSIINWTLNPQEGDSESQVFIGGVIGGSLGITDNITAGLNIGYNTASDAFDFDGFDMTLLTINPNGRYWFDEVLSGFSAGVDVNIVMQSFGGIAEDQDSETEFGASAIVSYDHPFNDNLRVGVNVGYGMIFDADDEEGVDNSSMIPASIRATFLF